jgi:hypothetical protein
MSAKPIEYFLNFRMINYLLKSVNISHKQFFAGPGRGISSGAKFHVHKIVRRPKTVESDGKIVVESARRLEILIHRLLGINLLLSGINFILVDKNSTLGDPSNRNH